MNRLLKVLAVLAAAFSLSNASAAVVLNVSASGLLTGATGVMVGGSLYDVAFKEGTCAEVFGSCAEGNFQFRTGADAYAASLALFSQVVQNLPEGSFDADPSKMFGCNTSVACGLLTPYDVVVAPQSETQVWASEAVNVFGTNDNYYAPVFVDPSFTSIDGVRDPNFEKDTVWVVWTLEQVPEPGSLALVAVGLLGATVVRLGRRDLPRGSVRF